MQILLKFFKNAKCTIDFGPNLLTFSILTEPYLDNFSKINFLLSNLNSVIKLKYKAKLTEKKDYKITETFFHNSFTNAVN